MCHTQTHFTLIVWYLFTHLKHLKVFGKGGRNKTDEPAEIWPRTVVLHFDWCLYNLIFQIKATVNKSWPTLIVSPGSEGHLCAAIGSPLLSFSSQPSAPPTWQPHLSHLQGPPREQLLYFLPGSEQHHLSCNNLNSIDSKCKTSGTSFSVHVLWAYL